MSYYLKPNLVNLNQIHRQNTIFEYPIRLHYTLLFHMRYVSNKNCTVNKNTYLFYSKKLKSS